MSSPYEIIAAPVTGWTAASNSTIPPNMDADPAVAYTKIGANGSANYSEDGVVVTKTQTVEMFSGLGKTGPLKVWRTFELCTVEFTVMDARPETITNALNRAALTTVASAAGVSGRKEVSLLLGYDISLFCLYLKTDVYSPYADGLFADYWLPLCWQDDAPVMVWKKGVPVGVKFVVKTLQDLTNGFGKYRAESAVSS